MKPLKWLPIIIAILFLVGCSPTTDLNPTPPEPAPIIEAEPKQNDPDVATPSESENEQVELAQPSSIIEEENPGEPIETEELPTMPPQNLANPDELPQVNIAKEDLAARLNIAKDSIEVIKVELVTWPNGALGCPQPGMAYTQVMQDGLLIQLSVDSVTYNYHSGGARDPFLCQPAPSEKPTPFNLELNDFITPPANTIDE